MPENVCDVTVFRSPAEMSAFSAELKAAGNRIGVVPTMGALHEGHLSLVDHSLTVSDATIVSLFVNPTQFAPTDDLDQYPRPFDRDMELLASRGIRWVFAPTKEGMYPPGWSTKLNPPAVAKPLEGEFRDGHFGGVATVVLKLLNITRAEVACFGQKDFQQVAVLKAMIADLNVPVELSVCPIVRDEDGLALSSRNVYLSDEERSIALSLSRTLRAAKEQIDQGETDAFVLISEMRQMLIDGGVDSIDYAVIADPITLKVPAEITGQVVALLAAHVGGTRLIDNCIIG